jgi:glycosyltransferase involved in cell wall biosynthesis
MRTLTLPGRPAAPEACPVPRRPVRVCFLIDELAAAGTETQLLALIRRLDRRRVLPYLALLRGEGAASRALEPDCCPVLRLGVGSLKSPGTLVRAVRFARFLRRERIDVVQTYFNDSSYFGVPVARLAGVPHRLRTRNNIGHWVRPLHRLLGRALNRWTTGTVTNCEAARRSLLADERPRPETVVVLENGVDLERFLAIPPPDPVGERVTVGAVANLRPVKGLDVLVRAAAWLSCLHPRVTFRVAGEGEQRGELEAAVRAAGLAGRFELPGATDDVPGFLAGVDVAVLPSRAEGMSNALLEYMAACRPVVASAVGATPDLIVHGESGLLVPPGDEVELARALARLLTEPGLAARLGAAARRASRRRSREAMVRRFEEFYTRLLEGRTDVRVSATPA